MRRQGLYALSGNVSKQCVVRGYNASSGNVSSQCVVRGDGDYRESVVAIRRQRQCQKSYPSCGRPFIYIYYKDTQSHMYIYIYVYFVDIYVYMHTIIVRASYLHMIEQISFTTYENIQSHKWRTGACSANDHAHEQARTRARKISRAQEKHRTHELDAPL